MLPCNIIVQKRAIGKVEVSAVDTSAYMQSIENKNLQDIYTEIRVRFKKVIDHF